MTVRSFALGPLKTNCYLLSAPDGATYVVDPGNEVPVLLAAMREHQLSPRAILLTHAHFDHIGAVPGLVDALHLPVLMPPAEEALYRHPRNCMLPYAGPVQGLPATVATLPAPALIAALPFTTLLTPGHTPGGVSYYFPDAACVFTGDALFAGAIGRTDLPGGDWETLMHSLRQVLLRLPDDTRVYPGHGPATTIGRERRDNPYLQAD